ncbi:MAG: replicative DNA helicase [Kiritimatiellia bacterium]|nr:replicative DNA helicase [Lentisphaerota bacterium]
MPVANGQARGQRPKTGAERRPLFSSDAERGVLGAILLDWQKVLDFCVEKQLAPESFYLQAHQLIFETMLSMSRDARPVDVLTLAERLSAAGRLDNVGGITYLNQLLDATPTAAHAEYYVDIVRQLHLLRRIVECAHLSENTCYTSEETADAILAKVEQDFFEISEGRHGTMMPWPVAVDASVETINNILDLKKGISGVPTGFRDLDEKILGMHKQEMIVLAARPSMGKTSLAMNIVENVALGHADHNPRPVGIFSLEMSSEQLIMRMLGSHARIPAHRIASGYLTAANHGLLMQAADILKKAPIFLDDTGGLDIMELRARARRMKRKHNIELIVIDYLQLLHSESHRREGRQIEIAHISGSIKNMAKELKVPVLVLSQLNRAPETRDRAGKPRLADLRDSGSIEQDADVVCMLRRPSKYTDDAESAGESSNEAILDIAKQRNGPTGEIHLVFREEIMRFENMATGGMYRDEMAPAEDR